MKTVLVTGANRGIGLALVQVHVARGDRLIGACRHGSDELAQTGARVESGVDVGDDAAVDDLARRLDGVRIDVLWLNAGIMARNALGSLDAAGFASARQQFEVNALGPLRVAQALLPNLGEGSKVGIITSRMGSIGDNGSGGYYGYRMSKAALNAAGMSLARDLASSGIAVAILHPGYVRTEMTEGSGNIDPDGAAKQLVERIDALAPETTGTFWHANGQVLPW